MSFCNILNNNAYSVAFWRQVRLQRCSTRREETLPRDEIRRLASPGLRWSRCGVKPARVSIIRKIGSIFGESQRLIYAQALGSYVPGRTILCKLANNSPLAHHTRDKLGCCIISYRNIISFFSRQFLGNFSANLKLSLNRGTPTLLLNSYLTNLYRLFVSFCYPEGDKKSVKMEGAK